MKSSVGHLQINVKPENLPFYKELFGFLNWSVLYEDATVLGVGGENGASLWFSEITKTVNNDYDGPGMNHLGISVGAQCDVDEAARFLQEHNVPALFDTPRHRPDFSSEPDTYYQVMFESPDRVLFEIVYTGPKSA